MYGGAADIFVVSYLSMNLCFLYDSLQSAVSCQLQCSVFGLAWQGCVCKFATEVLTLVNQQGSGLWSWCSADACTPDIAYCAKTDNYDIHTIYQYHDDSLIYT